VRPLGDEAFERLYAEHAQPLYAFLSYRTGDRVLAEDLLADTFERALRARWRFDRRKASEKTWLYSIALNLLRDQYRRQGSEAKALQSLAATVNAGSSGGIEQISNRDLVARGIEALSEEEREAIALRFGAELTVPEIAKLTDQKLTTVEGRVYRALRKLREALDSPTSGGDDREVVAGQRRITHRAAGSHPTRAARPAERSGRLTR
jgi:RNA polymerase sigma factor (sigma-70 family)